MPSWMIDSLSQMHAQFENGVSVRCRSSTNNEDLPEYSGAGLYDSKTHHPDEGHISKTIRQVYASLWNLRAFDEREFNRVDHFSSAMGVLCHPNYDSEVVNGVGVTSDPVYSTDDNFYLNSQLGEELITNPNTTRPEELLIKKIPSTEEDLVIIQYSSLLDTDSLLMNSLQLDSLRQYMKVIHDRFEILYNAVGNESFAMDVEFKITANNKLAIKQARPWVSYKASPIEMKNDLDCDYSLAPNPCHDVLYLRCRDCQDVEISVFNGLGQLCLLPDSFVLDTSTFMFNVGGLPDGVYIIQGLPNGGSCGLKFIKQ
jgi:phosphoenolpyruvate synthase/pyruvate phosphate dikinase